MPPALTDTRALVGVLLADDGPAQIANGPCLLAIEGPRAGQRLPLHDGAVLGRGREVDLRLEGGLTSRRHAQFIRAGAGWRVQDLGSKNGLRVNGRIAERGALRLTPGDLIALGESVLLFEQERARASGAAREREPRPRAARPAWRASLAAGAALLAAAAALAAAAS